MQIWEIKLELERLHAFSFGWALSCCRFNRLEAEEVLQITYLKILDGKAHYAGEAAFKTWLFAVIRKTALNECRKSVMRRLILSAGADRLPRDSQPEDLVRAVERSETQAHFRQALTRLPARQRETLHLVFYEELTLQETAEVLGISLGAVRKHYERAKTRLRELLQQSENNYGVYWRREKDPSAV